MRIDRPCPRALYYGSLMLALAFYTSFTIAFFVGYFDPYFFSEVRATAHLQTVLGFLDGINPYDNAHLDEYGNLYSVVWPYLNYLIANVLGLEGYFEIKALMYALNAFFVCATAFAALFVGLRNKLDPLLVLGIAFTFLLINTTKTTMGEFSYAGGVCAGFLALVVARNRFDKTGLFLALFLVTLASLFKIYFALFGVVVISAYAAVFPLRVVIQCVAFWLVATFLIYFGLTQIFPNYFEAIYGLIGTEVIRRFSNIVPQIGWGLLNFSFAGLFALPTLFSLAAASQDARRREIYFLTGAALVCTYVVFAMLPHTGNFGTYILNLVIPLSLAYPLGKPDRDMRPIGRWVGACANLVLILLVFVVPKYDGTGMVRWTGWKAYGVTSRADLDGNRELAAEVKTVLDENAGRSIYLDFPLAPIAVGNEADYIDTGNREYFSKYMELKQSGTAETSILVGIFAYGNAFEPKLTDPRVVMERADIVICVLRCPGPETHALVRELSPIYMAYNARSLPVKYFVSLHSVSSGPENDDL